MLKINLEDVINVSIVKKCGKMQDIQQKLIQKIIQILMLNVQKEEKLDLISFLLFCI